MRARVPDKPMECGLPLSEHWANREYSAECPHRHNYEKPCLWYIIAVWDSTGWRIDIMEETGSRSGFYAGKTLTRMQEAGRRAILAHLRQEHFDV